MRCRIADLITEVPEADGMEIRCRGYNCKDEGGADIVIRTDLYDFSKYPPNLSRENLVYMETGRQFYARFLDFNGFYLHASAVELDGRVYLFSGNSGVGKSTHVRQWQKLFGDTARVLNDDKPALRNVDGVWYAYGTPWCGKDGININAKAPVAALCFLKQAPDNSIRRMEKQEAFQNILKQTLYRYRYTEKLDKILLCIEKLLEDIPVFELQNRPEPDAARLSYNTMHDAAKEIQP